MHLGYELIVILVMLLCTAIFAGYEMALASVSRARLMVLFNRKRSGAEEALYMKERMEASLAVTQLGITLSGAIAAATGGVGVAEALTPYLMGEFGISKTFAEIVSLIFLIVPLSALMITIGELIPKMYALNNREWVCLSLSPAMKIIAQFFYPVITIFEWLVKKAIHFEKKSRYFKRSYIEDQQGLHELTAAVALARTSRLIGAREEKIVLSAAQLSTRPVREIMLPLGDISMIPQANSLADALIRAHLDMHTRFPVCAQEGDPQTIQGYINFKDIISALKLNPADPSIKGIVRPLKTVQGETPISQVLEQMMQEKLHIALVENDAKRTIGMVTLEDIIEELVGEIEDEFDRLPTHVHPYGGGWIMGGGVPMNVVAQTVGIEWKEKPGETVPKLAEWCAKKFGGGLKGGEMLEYGKLQVTVRKLRRRKLGEAIVSLVHQ